MIGFFDMMIVIIPFLIIFFIVGRLIYNRIKNRGSPKQQDYKAETFTKMLKSIDDVREYIVQEYFKGKSHIHFNVFFHIDPDIVLALVTDKRFFPFHNKYRCKVISSDDLRRVELQIEYTQGFKVFLAIINYNYESLLTDTEKTVLQKIKHIANSILNTSMSQYDKARTIHDYLISTSSYDFENYQRNSIPDVSYTPYGILFEHKAVCQAYAETFMIFMTLIGIESYMVVGKLNSCSDIASDNHAWNIVKINGKYGHVDVTSDNPFYKNNVSPLQRYFFVSTEQLLKTHSWNPNHYPLC